MIQLSESERKVIKFCKGHFGFPEETTWIEAFKPVFEEIYGWSPSKHYEDYQNTLFKYLLDIYLKIQEDKSGSNNELKGIFNACFYKSIVRPEETPKLRAISELIGLIQCNMVKDRYEL